MILNVDFALKLSHYTSLQRSIRLKWILKNSSTILHSRFNNHTPCNVYWIQTNWQTIYMPLDKIYVMYGYLYFLDLGAQISLYLHFTINHKIFYFTPQKKLSVLYHKDFSKDPVLWSSIKYIENISILSKHDFVLQFLWI